MDISQYRRQCQDDVRKAPKPVDQDLDAAMRVLRNPKATDKQRDTARRSIAKNIEQDPNTIDELLELLRDTDMPADQRTEILYLLRQLSFRFALFPAKRPAYLSALRDIVDDPDPTLRRRAVGTLAREKDEYIQRRLIAGLEGNEKALVPTAKAIQLLGYDVHAEYLPLLRRFVEDPPNQSARKEAIRLLAADADSADLLLEILRDREEKPDVRRISAIALQAIAPEVELNESRRIAADDSEPPELRAMALTSLTQSDTEPGSRAYTEQIQQLADQSSSRQVKRAANAFMAKHG